MRYRNPPDWAKKVLRDEWRAIEKAFGKAYMPKKGIDTWDYGTGYYGSVFPTNTTGVVFKITADPSEGEFVTALSESFHKEKKKRTWDKNTDGLVRYYKIMKLDSVRLHEDEGLLPIYAIVRQEAHVVGAYNVSQFFDTGEWNEFEDSLRNFVRSASTIEYYTRGIASMRDADKIEHTSIFNSAVALMYEVFNLKEDKIGYAIGRTLHYFIKQGFLISDAHVGNIGLVSTVGHPVIIDPGRILRLKPKSYFKEIERGIKRGDY